VWTDPSVWRGGPIEFAELHGAFEIGSTITTKVEGNRRLTSTIARIDEPRCWVGVAKAPGLTMTIDHVIEPVDTGALLTERLTFSGPLAALASRLMGSRIASTFRLTTEHAAELAEARQRTAAPAGKPC
jgi:hypothetical protein